jgi:hypothetical protein
MPIKYKEHRFLLISKSSISSSAFLHHHSSTSTKHYTKETLTSPPIQNEDLLSAMTLPATATARNCTPTLYYCASTLLEIGKCAFEKTEHVKNQT